MILVRRVLQNVVAFFAEGKWHRVRSALFPLALVNLKKHNLLQKNHIHLNYLDTNNICLIALIYTDHGSQKQCRDQTIVSQWENDQTGLPEP